MLLVTVGGDKSSIGDHVLEDEALVHHSLIELDVREVPFKQCENLYACLFSTALMSLNTVLNIPLNQVPTTTANKIQLHAERKGQIHKCNKTFYFLPSIYL